MLRLFPDGLLIALQIGCLGDALSAASVPPQQSSMQIDDMPLFTIGDDPNEPLHRVIGAVLTGDVLIVARRAHTRCASTTGRPAS